MALTYFKRFRMEYDLRSELFVPPPLPSGYWLLSWDERLLDAHATAKYESFRFELDANVFPCLGDMEGCHRLIREIANRPGFTPQATWLIGTQNNPQKRFEYCGTIQGIRDERDTGSIQNLGITPGHRSRGLGQILMWNALRGFREIGLEKASLEVTAQNSRAFELYRRLGFQATKTVYKAIDVAYA